MSRRFPHEGAYVVELRCSECRSIAGGVFLESGEPVVEIADMANARNPRYQHRQAAQTWRPGANDADTPPMEARDFVDLEPAPEHAVPAGYAERIAAELLDGYAADRRTAFTRPQLLRWFGSRLGGNLYEFHWSTQCKRRGHVLPVDRDAIEAAVRRWHVERRKLKVTLTR